MILLVHHIYFLLISRVSGHVVRDFPAKFDGAHQHRHGLHLPVRSTGLQVHHCRPHLARERHRSETLAKGGTR